MNKLIVFDIWADYAHFKKYYTTTSPLTFSIPPKTTIYGIVGAILGLDKNDYLNYFQMGQCKVGIQIMKPINKTRISINLIDTKNFKQMSNIKNRTQIRTEYLKDVKYRIYFYHKEKDIYDKLKLHLEEHKTVYSISLGLSENLANFEFIGEYNAQKIENNQEWIDISTVISANDKHLTNKGIDFSENREYFSDKIALHMKPNREVIEYGQVVFERNGKKIKAKLKEYYKLENGDNCFLI